MRMEIVNLMSNYIVLFEGTKYVDGVYKNKEIAEEVMELFEEEKFPYLMFGLYEVPRGFEITDDIFWANHKKYLHALNRATAEEVTHH